MNAHKLIGGTMFTKRNALMLTIALGAALVLAGCGRNGADGDAHDPHSTGGAPTTSGADDKAGYYTCPMHPSVVSEKPGSCPVCGMDLVWKASPPPSDATAKEFYTCPMHPSVVSEKPGSCPVCGMDLVKKTGGPAGQTAGLPASVTISPAQRVTANVATTVASLRRIAGEVRAVGVVDYAEPLRMKVAARFAGRIERLHAATTGEVVRRGQPLFEIHSPELYAAEREFLLAARALRDPGGATDTNRLLMFDAAMDRLHIHFGLTHDQIHALADSGGRPKDTVFFYSPVGGTVISKNVQEGQYVEEGAVLYDIADLSTVWIYLDVYEQDFRFVKLGSAVGVRTDAWPGETFEGRVTFVDPVVNAETRTVRVRSEFANPDGRLKPQMYVEASIHSSARQVLAVPSSAVMFTGNRNLVWVEVADNQFEPREVRVGTAGAGWVEIAAGLHDGEAVVTSGGYLLDSESQLRMPATGSGGHDH